MRMERNKPVDSSAWRWTKAVAVGTATVKAPGYLRGYPAGIESISYTSLLVLVYDAYHIPGIVQRRNATFLPYRLGRTV